MKKLITVLLTLVMALGMLTGCGSDPVADELGKFLNTDMVGINAKYDDLKTEMAKWDSFKDDKALIANLKNTVLPNINDSLDMLSKIELKTEDVKVIKEKYKKVLEAYKGGFQGMISASEADDVKGIEAATEKIDEGVKLLDDYNKALEALAKEKNMEIEY